MSSLSKKVVFSFCIYGTNKKYCQGLVENLKIIKHHYPNYYTYIYFYHDVPDSYLTLYKSFPNVTLRKTDHFTHPNMVERFFVLDEDPSVDIMIVRDADSRIHARDRFCIDKFIESDFSCHTIRDHHLHHSPILGGLWGLKRNALVGIDMRGLYREYKESVKVHSPESQYGHDMYFLRFCIYPKILDSFIVFTFAAYQRIDEKEFLVLLPSDIPDGNFCGQVLDYDENGNEVQQYTFPV